MIPKYLMFAVGLVAVASIGVGAMGLAILQQDADASTRGCKNSIAVNASLGRCVKADKPHPEAENADVSDELDESDGEEEEDDE